MSQHKSWTTLLHNGRELLLSHADCANVSKVTHFYLQLEGQSGSLHNQYMLKI